MAKSGRAMAQRRKVEVIDAGSADASKTVEVHDCGTLFFIDATNNVVITMPAIAAAGNGWWCEFHLGTAVATSKSVVINLAAADGNSDANLIEAADSGSKVAISNSDLTLDAACPIGSKVVYECINGKYFVHTTA